MHEKTFKHLYNVGDVLQHKAFAQADSLFNGRSRLFVVAVTYIYTNETNNIVAYECRFAGDNSDARIFRIFEFEIEPYEEGERSWRVKKDIQE